MNNLFWLQHCRSWFAFTEPAHFEVSKEGGFFANSRGDHIFSVLQSGHKKPFEHRQAKGGE